MPIAPGTMLYQSILIQVEARPSSCHHLYSITKFAAAVIAQRNSTRRATIAMTLRAGEGRERGERGITLSIS